MNNQIELFVKLFFPAIIVIAWLLNQVLNRDPAQAAKGARGPRPGGPMPAPRGDSRRPTTFEEWDASQRRQQTPPPSTAPRRSDEEIIIIKSETMRTGSRPPQRGQQRRANTGRNRGNQAARRSEPQTPRPAAPASPTGLAATATALSARASEVTRAGSVWESESPMMIGVSPTPTADSLRASLANRDRLREIFLLNELLMPPLAARRRGASR